MGICGAPFTYGATALRRLIRNQYLVCSMGGRPGRKTEIGHLPLEASAMPMPPRGAARSDSMGASGSSPRTYRHNRTRSEFDRALRNRHMSAGVEEVGQQPGWQHDVAAAAPRDAVSNVAHFLAQPNDDMSGDEVAHDVRRRGRSVILSVVLLTLILLHDMRRKAPTGRHANPTLVGWLG